MTLEQIKQTISNYDELINLATDKIKLMGSLDSIYDTARGIEEISFDGDDIVHVRYDTTCYGCYDCDCFSFPLSYLSLDDSELKVAIEQDKIKRIENEQLIKDENEFKERIDKEKRELKLYKQLKEKFDKQVE